MPKSFLSLFVLGVVVASISPFRATYAQSTACSLPEKFYLDTYEYSNLDAALIVSDHIKSDPTNPANFVNRATILFDLHMIEATLSDYDRAIAIDADYIAAYLGKAKVYLFEGDYQYAIDNLEVAIELGLENNSSDEEQLYEAYLLLSEVYTQSGSPNISVGFLDLAIELKPNEARGYAMRGFANALLSNNDQSENDWKTALDYDPNVASYFVDLSFAYYQWENYIQSDTKASYALSLESESAPSILVSAHFIKGLSLHEKKLFDQAVLEFTLAIETDLNCAAVYNSRGYSYLNLGQFELALTDFNQALQIDPSFLDAYNGRLSSYENLGDLESADHDRQYYVSHSNMFSAEIYIKTGKLMFELENYDAAEVSFLFAAGFEPDDAEIYLMLARIYQIKGSPDFELKAYDSYIEIMGENARQDIIERAEELRSQLQ